MWSDNRDLLFLANNPTVSVKVKTDPLLISLWVYCEGKRINQKDIKAGILQLRIASHNRKGN